jgi:ATPase subunit of ABC transporter with duplicated ATPase domains
MISWRLSRPGPLLPSRHVEHATSADTLNPQFIDSLQLARRDFSRTRVIVLCGESGSGKSTAIRFLMHQHPHLRDDARVRVIEELRHWRDLGIFFSALNSGHRFLVASHLPPWLHRCLSVGGATEIIELDRHHKKITDWLSANAIVHSEAAVSAFCARFGANYTDVRLILQHADATSFDQALGRFLKQCRLERGGVPDGMPVLVMPVAQAEAHYRLR